MGYMTTVCILNDGFDQIRENAQQVVDDIISASYRGGTVRAGNFANPIEVMRTEHADAFRLFCTWQNSLVELSEYAPETMRLAETEHTRKWLEQQVRIAQRNLTGLKAALKAAKP